MVPAAALKRFDDAVAQAIKIATERRAAGSDGGDDGRAMEGATAESGDDGKKVPFSPLHEPATARSAIMQSGKIATARGTHDAGSTQPAASANGEVRPYRVGPPPQFRVGPAPNFMGAGS